jgi:hypothetical protein
MSKEEQDDLRDFLDDADDLGEAIGSSSKFQEQTLEEILYTPSSIDYDAFTQKTATIPSYNYTMTVLRTLAEDFTVTESVMLSNCAAHGIAIAEHKHHDMFTIMHTLERAAISSDRVQYFDHSCKISFGKDTGNYPVFIDRNLASRLTKLSSVFRAYNKDVLGYCILLSVLTSTDALQANSRMRFKQFVDRIETGILLQKTLATHIM